LTASIFVCLAQVSAGQVDDFEDGTVQNWIIGATGDSSPVNISSGGPNGVDDNFLEYTSTGGGGIASRMAIFNSNNQWSGDFINAGVLEIQMDVEVLTSDLYLRLAFQGPNGSRMISAAPVIVTAGSGWTSIAIPTEADDFTIVQGANTVTEVLQGAFTMRIISVRDENIDNWRGEVVAATLRVDNITASTTLSTNDIIFEKDFNIFPNPSTSMLNISLNQFDVNSKIEVFNILGSKIFTCSTYSNRISIDASKWQNGFYLVKLTSDNGSITKRFVKR